MPYISVKYEIHYYQSFTNTNVLLYKESIKGSKNIKQLVYGWKKSNKKSINSKYKWYKSRSYVSTKYKATKITYKYVNGKFVKKSINKKFKYSKNGKFKNERTVDWSKYVLPSVDCESDNKKITDLSKKIIKSEAKRLKKPVSKLTDKQKANAILKWVQKKFRYEEYGNTRYGALKSLNMKKLNCVDSTHITIALLRAANIPAKYNAKNVGKDGHCWPCAYFGGKWIAGEPTDHIQFSKFGKSSWTNKKWVKPKAKPGTNIDSYKYSKKFVQNGKPKTWMAIIENHYIGGKWLTYYVLEGNADTTFNKINLNKIKITMEG